MGGGSIIWIRYINSNSDLLLNNRNVKLAFKTVFYYEIILLICGIHIGNTLWMFGKKMVLNASIKALWYPKYFFLSSKTTLLTKGITP